MSETAIAGWLHGWLSRKAPVPDIAPSADENFFEAGWIDLLGIIELIEDVETEFGIRFSARYFQDRTFPTINGLAKIIAVLQKERQNDAHAG